MAAGHWRVDQMKSWPEVMFMVTLLADTSNVHAAATRVRKLERDDHVAAADRSSAPRA